MAESKSGSISPGGPGVLARRVQRKLSRAQEKVLQKLGRASETKDENFEQCSQNVSKQQTDGNKLFKDLKAYISSIKVMREASRQLSETLLDVYESDLLGDVDLSLIVEREEPLWSDFEGKLTDQTVGIMDNYMSQFPEVKEKMAKRGRKLVDFDSCLHHLEALQNSKKKDEVKIDKAREEFKEAQSIFDDINAELREELPALYQSRIGCYVTVFQNLSNLRDIFYQEMYMLNRDVHNVMKKLETEHSEEVLVIKGLQRSGSKKRRSRIFSSPTKTTFPTLTRRTSSRYSQKSKESESSYSRGSLRKLDNQTSEELNLNGKSGAEFDRSDTGAWGSEVSLGEQEGDKRQVKLKEPELLSAQPDQSGTQDRPKKSPRLVERDKTEHPELTSSPGLGDTEARDSAIHGTPESDPLHTSDRQPLDSAHESEGTQLGPPLETGKED